MNLKHLFIENMNLKHRKMINGFKTEHLENYERHQHTITFILTGPILLEDYKKIGALLCF